jgi:hypothetical protein
MLSKEFAQEVAQLVFDMLEAKWEAKRQATAERKAEEARQKEKMRAEKMPRRALEMVRALKIAQDRCGGLPVCQSDWRREVQEIMGGATPGHIRTLFARYRGNLTIAGKVYEKDGFWGVTESASKSVTSVTSASLP